MRAAGIGASIHYPTPVHRQPAAVGKTKAAGSLDRVEAAADRILSLPIYPGLRDDEVDEVAAALKAAL
jgi:dTDP-4-amino-4,6-dideoxygalactose transaminase